jgi:hypothetical protein
LVWRYCSWDIRCPMRVGIIQSNYIPWRGYFDFIASVDLFVFYDDVQYTKNDWRNRNRIKTKDGVQWLSVPVQYRFTARPRIEDTEIEYATDWPAEHEIRFRESYSRAPHWRDALAIFSEGLVAKDRTISQLNIRLIRLVCSYLGIRTAFTKSSDYAPQGTRTERLIDILKKAGASIYLSGPSAAGYIDAELFAESGIGLEFKDYSYPSYPQQWGEYEATLTILDLIANCGPDSKAYLRTNGTNAVIVPPRK